MFWPENVFGFGVAVAESVVVVVLQAFTDLGSNGSDAVAADSDRAKRRIRSDRLDAASDNRL